MDSQTFLEVGSIGVLRSQLSSELTFQDLKVSTIPVVERAYTAGIYTDNQTLSEVGSICVLHSRISSEMTFQSF